MESRIGELVPEQRAAFDGALEHVRNPRRRSYSIQGRGGTGKSFVMSCLVHALPNAIPCAFTAKAASVLTERTGKRAVTLHSVLYDFHGMLEDEETGKAKPMFSPKENPLDKPTLLLDESSMVGGRLGNDIEALGAVVITTGDPWQLQPVGDTQHFTRFDAELKEPHRFALESPIIRQSYAAHLKGAYANDTDDFRVVRKSTPDDRMRANVALCYRNKTRMIYNRVRRSDGGLPARRLTIGEPIMCLRNNYNLRIFNGVIYTVASDWTAGENLALREEGTGRTINVFAPAIEDFTPHFDEQKNEDGVAPFALAYAVTGHKSQGSEWDSTLVIDEHPRNEMWKYHIYTSLTRAKKRVLVVRQ